MKPNLFNYATSELSNDAMICWILEWGNYKESELYPLSKELIGLILKRDISLETVKVSKQYKNIDILAKINNKYNIAIEDKIDTVEHSDQLNRYKEILEDDFKENISMVYLTIGDECCYQYIYDKGYQVITRKDLLNVMENHRGKNDILDDYFTYLNEMENKFNLYQNESDISKWEDRRTWAGFYSYLKEKIIKEESKWGYVNNPRGGFCAFTWAVNTLKYKDNIEYYTYLQIEEDRITFKVEVVDKEYQSEIRNYVWNKLKLILDENEYYARNIFKTRFQKGTWMTIATLNQIKNKEDIFNAIEIAEEVNILLNTTLTLEGGE